MTTPTLSEVIALLPCPFCGCPGEELELYPIARGPRNQWRIDCGNPSCITRENTFYLRTTAITAWNNRTSAASLRDEGDSARLDWLHDQLRGVDLYNTLYPNYDLAVQNIREAIDAAMATQPAAQERQA